MAKDNVVVVIVAIQRITVDWEGADAWEIEGLLGTPEAERAKGKSWFVPRGDKCNEWRPRMWSLWLKQKIMNVAKPGDRVIFYLK